MKRLHGLVVAVVLGVLAVSPCWSNNHDPAAKAVSTENARPLLNSERIKQKYGSYGIDVLQDDGKVRISSLYTTRGSQKTTRTLAVVVYPELIPVQIQQEHQAITAGGSIGEVFARKGWCVVKENLYFGEIKASLDFEEIYSLMGGIEETNLAVHVYRLSVCRAGSCFAYATLSEVHHPDYLGLSDLREIYGGSKIALDPGAKNERDVQLALDLTITALATQ
ncbi:MAG: hypothetical protein EXR85_04750 [Xanthomonadales bacterium]|nr:hypothetical protein [Xanthomonadales bacterium]